ERRPTRRHAGAPISLCPATRGGTTRRRSIAPGARAVGARRTALSTGGAAPSHLCLQARPDSGGGVSIAAQEHAGAVPSAYCPGVGRALSRDGGDAARTAGAALHRGGARGTGSPLLAAGRQARHGALGARGGDRAL